MDWHPGSVTLDSCFPLGAPGPLGSGPLLALPRCAGGGTGTCSAGPVPPGPPSFHLSPTNSEWPGAWEGSLRPALASEADSITNGVTHTQHSLGPGSGGARLAR